MAKIILITGASRGFGKLWAKALLKRGDKVAVTARKLQDLNELVAEFGNAVFPVELNVDDRKACFAAVQQVKDHFGRIDVVVNNAGFGLFGAVEETTEEQARNQMQTNFFGLLWMTQAVLPIMRAQQSGHIVQVSSFLGLITVPFLGLYNASKYAVNGLSETLASEIKAFGVKVSMIEPNGYLTDWATVSSVHTEPQEVYSLGKKEFEDSLTHDTYGIPENTVSAFLQLIDSNNPPLHFLLGENAYAAVKDVYSARIAEFEDWKEVAILAHGSH